MNVDLAAQTALGDGTDTLSSIENANGSNFADLLSGNGGPNTLNGLGGNDQIDGGGGADRSTAARRRLDLRQGRLVDTITCGGGRHRNCGLDGRRERRLRDR